jgi:phosphoglycolate phosphatase-like HAD superfamily hydrolase
MIRLALFDIDGTLIRTGGAGIKAFAHALRSEFGRTHGTERIRFGGRTDTSLVRELFTYAGVDHTHQNVQRFFDCYVFWLDHLLRESAAGGPCPGVRSLLRQLQSLPQAPLLGLLTGNIRLGAEIKLRHYDLWDPFALGGFGDDDEDRNAIASVAQQRGAQALGRPLEGHEILVVGDTPHDIECGRAIGARTLAVATGGAATEELLAHQPDWLVTTLESADARELCA